MVVFDDIQWGEETFLDLVEATALLVAAPLLLLRIADLAGVDADPARDVQLGECREHVHCCSSGAQCVVLVPCGPPRTPPSPRHR